MSFTCDLQGLSLSCHSAATSLIWNKGVHSFSFFKLPERSPPFISRLALFPQQTHLLTLHRPPLCCARAVHCTGALHRVEQYCRRFVIKDGKSVLNEWRCSLHYNWFFLSHQVKFCKWWSTSRLCSWTNTQIFSCYFLAISKAAMHNFCYAN